MVLRPLFTACFVFCCSGVAGAAEHEISVVDYRFTPAELHVHKGDKVTWVNQEKRTSHSVLFIASSEESERFFPGERWSYTFNQTGRFAYRCGPHPEMQGVIVVDD